MSRVLGKVVLLTGAGQDGVAACAAALVKEGGRVAIADRDEAIAGKAAAAYDRRTALPLAFDVAIEAEWRRAMEAVLAHFGRLDGLVSGPPPMVSRRIRDWAIGDWRAFEDSHLVGPWLGTKHAIITMRKFNGGSIVYLSSVLGRMGRADAPANCAVAGGLRIMAQAAALECGQKGDGIRVNSVLVDPAKPFPDVDVAQAVVYLMSNDSTFVTASELVIDDGTLAA